MSFVSPWSHDYSADLIAREEAGTPNAVGDIRAALVTLLKAQVGEEAIRRRENQLNERALARWSPNDRIALLGNMKAPRIPIFSFQVRDEHGGTVHHQLVTRLLSDAHGVQARGGCACAGPYAHRLLDLSADRSANLRDRLAAGHELEKPGWTRVNFSYVMSDAEADAVVEAVIEVAETAEVADGYSGDSSTARFRFGGH